MSSPGPFALAARGLAARGLAVIPCGGDDGKIPLIKLPRRRIKPDGEGMAKLVHKFGQANIGILTKPSGVLIVDVDDPQLTSAMEERFGATPLITSTPRGGVHLWYRANGESNRNLRTEGIEADIKAGGAGKGGLVIVPPSVRPSGPHAGKSYTFIRGSWDDLAHLPTIKPGSYPVAAKDHSPPRKKIEGKISPGQRNDYLFDGLRSLAPTCDNKNELLGHGAQLNLMCSPPLPEHELLKVVESVWRYKMEGRIFADGESRAIYTRGDIGVFGGNGDAMLLHAHLQITHGLRKNPFAIAAKAMAEGHVIRGWAKDRYRRSRDQLLKSGWLKRVYRGGKGPGDGSKYILGKGPGIKPNNN